MTKNLWEETLEVLDSERLSWDQVIQVQGFDYQISKENFERIARETNYDAGYGSPKVASDLVLLGKDWWMSRGEYDGSEWWEFNAMPMPLSNVQEVETLTAHFGWEDLSQCNSPSPY